jgi:hypothetical protein
VNLDALLLLMLYGGGFLIAALVVYQVWRKR